MFLSKGFEDLEAVTFIDVLGWTRQRDNLTPIELRTCAFHNKVTGRFGIEIKVDHNIRAEKLDYSKFDAFVLPGGFHSHGFNEAYNSELGEIAKIFNKSQKTIATLCVGVLPISDAGLLKEKKATTYDLSRYHDNPTRLQKGGAIYTGSKVEFDNNVISCAGPASSLDVAYRLVELLTGKENLDDVKKLMIAWFFFIEIIK